MKGLANLCSTNYAYFSMAEGTGLEPARQLSPTPVFKTGAIPITLYPSDCSKNGIRTHESSFPDYRLSRSALSASQTFYYLLNYNYYFKNNSGISIYFDRLFNVFTFYRRFYRYFIKICFRHITIH